MRDNDKTRAERRDERQRNQGKMIVRGRGIFNLLRAKRNRESSNGRTSGFGPLNGGSTPSSRA